MSVDDQEEQTPTSFDALAHEMNLSSRMRDLCRIFWVMALKKGEERGRMLEQVANERPIQYRKNSDKP